MRFLIVGDEATVEDLEQAMTNLRAKQRNAIIQSTRDELREDIDELIEMWVRRRAVVQPHP